MRHSIKAILIAIAAALAVLMTQPGPSSAGDVILSHNSGGESAVFYIENEPSLVINGFDLTPHVDQFPVAVDAVSLSVSRATGANVDLVVYQDANGGSPADATLVHRQSVAINQGGFHRFLLSEAAIITEPVVWVGFYLPVGFRFHADVSGPSVLTYWGWTPGAAFDVRSPANAAVLGPGDGTDPVAIDMQGIARITAEMRPLFHQEMESDTLLGQQLVSEGEQDTSAMGSYPHCGGLLHDPEDISITSSSSFSIQCGVAAELDAPVEVVNPDGRLLDLQRAGHLYKLDARIPQAQLVHGAVNTLPVPVTHCMSIPPGDLEQAVIAEGRGIPERWHVLPSVRFGEMVCAEITTASYLSYFLPRGAGAPPNVNLALGWTAVNPHPIECGLPTYVSAPVVNTGQSWFSTVSGYVKFVIENIHVRTGTITGAVEISIETSQLGPGMRHLVHFAPIYVTTYVNELHRLQVRADFDNQIQETNEDDNVWFTEYILSNARKSDRCFAIPWLTATPTNFALVEGFCFIGDPRRRGEDKIEIRYSPGCEIKEFYRGRVPAPTPTRTPQEGEVVQGTSSPIKITVLQLRNCPIRVRVQVVESEVFVRYTDPDNCIGEKDPPGHRLQHYKQTRKVGDDDIHVLVIDHDGPPPTPTITLTPSETPNRSIDPPRDLVFSYSGESTKMLQFRWDSVIGADSYDLRYRLDPGTIYDWEDPPTAPGTGTSLAFSVDNVDRGRNYLWQVRVRKNGDHSPWSQSTFSVPTLPTPENLRVEDVPLSNYLKFSWDTVLSENSYEFQYRQRPQESWPSTTPTLLVPESTVEIVPKHNPYEWRVRAERGGPWAAATFHFQSSTLTPAAGTAIQSTAIGIPQPTNLMMASADDNNIVFSWNPVSGATGYEFQLRLSGQDDNFEPEPAKTVPANESSTTYEVGLANKNNPYDWRVRAVMGLAKGHWTSVTGGTI